MEFWKIKPAWGGENGTVFTPPTFDNAPQKNISPHYFGAEMYIHAYSPRFRLYLYKYGYIDTPANKNNKANYFFLI